MQRGFAAAYLLFGVLVLAALGGAYFFGKSQVAKPQTQNQVVSQTPQPVSSQSPNETATWKSYDNSDYSFLYPGNWTVTKMDYLNTVKIEDSDKTSIQISDKQYPYGFGGDLKMVSEEIQLKVGNQSYTVKETTIENESILIDFKLETAKEHHIIISQSIKKDQSWKETREVIIKVLSTFKFSDSNQTTDTANWKSYKSSAYKFEFKYPSQAELGSESQALDSETLLSQSINFQKENSFEAGVIDVTVSLIPFNENVKVWEGVAKTSSVSTLVNGVQAKKLEWVESERSDGKDLYNQKILFSKGSYTYLLSAYIYNNSNNKSKFLKAFNQILSTFRFD